MMGSPVGIPKTGVFGLLDLVGVDLIPKVAASMDRLLPAGDRLRANRREQPLIARMIADGLDRPQGQGRLLPPEPGERRAGQGGHRPPHRRLSRRARRPVLESVAAAKAGGLRALVTHPDRTGRYAWAVLSETLAYAAELVPAISDTVWGVDEAMRLGYNWQFGPFELIDQLGTGWFADRLAAEGRPVPELLRLARGEPFYRVQDGRLEQLGVDGELPAGATARRHADAGRCEASRGTPCCAMAPRRSGTSATAWPASSSPRR